LQSARPPGGGFSSLYAPHCSFRKLFVDKKTGAVTLNWTMRSSRAAGLTRGGAVGTGAEG